MNPMRNAIRLGLQRGWTEFSQSIRSTQDQGFYLFTAAVTVGYLFLRRNTEVEGTDLMLPSVALPSILGALIAFGVIIGPAYALAMEKDDGVATIRMPVLEVVVTAVAYEVTAPDGLDLPDLTAIDHVLHQSHGGGVPEVVTDVERGT